MVCPNIPASLLRQRIAVINLRDPVCIDAITRIMPKRDQWGVCLERLATQGRIERLRRNLYLVIDPVREIPFEAIATGCFSHASHYVTTDLAFRIHRLIDQPIPVVRIVTNIQGMEAVYVRGLIVQPVQLETNSFAAAGQYMTTSEGYPVIVATKVQAVVDALAQPSWMTNFSLLPEILRALSPEEVDEVAGSAMRRARAAVQRLGFLLEDAGVDAPPQLVEFHPTSAISLRPGRKGGAFSTRWMTYD